MRMSCNIPSIDFPAEFPICKLAAASDVNEPEGVTDSVTALDIPSMYIIGSLDVELLS